MSLHSTFAAFALLVAAPALAGQVDCSSADQRASVQHSSSDGGAYYEPTTKVVLDGKTLFESTPWGPTRTDLVTVDETNETQISFTPLSDKSPQVRVYVETLTLTDKQTGKVLFADDVLCKDVSHPCPLCP